MRISERQLEQINKQVQRLIAADNFYGKKLKEAGITEVKTEDDFLKLPFSQKQDLRDAYPLGLMAVPEEEVVRIGYSVRYENVYLADFAVESAGLWQLSLSAFFLICRG